MRDRVGAVRPARERLGSDPVNVGATPQRLGIVVPTDGRYDSRTVRIAGALADRGHQVTVVARPGGARQGADEAARYRIVRVGREAAARLPLPLRILDRAAATRAQTHGALQAGVEADIWHAMGLLALPVALALGADSGAPVVYDARDLYADARSLSRLPGLARGVLRARERGWASRASGTITVNEALADVLESRLGARPWVVMNCPPRWTPPDPPERRFHAALGLPDTARIVLYHGGFVPERGIEQLLAALPTLPAEAVVVLLGYGPLRDGLVALAGSAGLSGRVHVLDAVPPTELPAWVASADVGVVAIQPTTLNHRLSTPNKLFETLGAGVPVVASDFPAMRAIVLGDPDGPLGAVCDPTDPAAIAAAIGEILARPPAEAADLRARCLRAAHARYSWETQLRGLLDVYQGLAGHPW